MVYKIRNKSFFWTRAGWKNNWHPKNFNAPRPSSSEFTIGIRCRYDHNSFLRGIEINLIYQLTIHTERSLDTVSSTSLATKNWRNYFRWV
ncbi:unnamed protein product [Paramecium octaurelia]|uniref:Uncharacterized protein n=1 Tax=Paramecium octaurelia TaxID=43137 RepID=A0A8S1XHY6_PAROT|nr:unnamed protein product [Paramecium octaurelia]